MIHLEVDDKINKGDKLVRTLVSGIKNKSDKIFDYDVEKNFIFEVY